MQINRNNKRRNLFSRCVKAQFSYRKDKAVIHFQLVNGDFPIATDGILGRDFLINYLCKIDYETLTITINLKDKEYILPINTKIPTNKTVEIPPRTEIILPIKLNIQEDSVVFNQEIQKGVFLANSIAPAKGISHVKIMNVNSHAVNIEEFKCTTEKLTNYNILNTHTQTNTYNNERFNKLMKELKLNNLGKETETELKEIFRKYQSIFHLEGEKLSVNNFYNQKLNRQRTGIHKELQTTTNSARRNTKTGTGND